MNKEEIIDFISINSLNIFSSTKTPLKLKQENIFKTSDARKVYNKSLSKISEGFIFAETYNLFNLFPFTQDINLIKNRQSFFKTIQKTDNSFLSNVNKPKKTWKPNYSVLVVTENEKTYNELITLDCPTKLLISDYDVQSLESYEVIQAIDVQDYSRALESLNQLIFLDSIDEVYLERHLEVLSSWKENIQLISRNNTLPEIKQICNELSQLFPLLESESLNLIRRDDLEAKINKINEIISEKIKNLTISGAELLSIMSNKSLPQELKSLINEEIKKQEIPSVFLKQGFPLSLDEEELEKHLKKKESEKNASFSIQLKKNSNLLINVEKNIKKLSSLLIYFDFISGISKISYDSYPENSTDFSLKNSHNIFIDNPQPIDFNLNQENRCSILTGANSGGKTTLLEHIIQLITLFNLGIPIKGQARLPLFKEVYYFAKNKGSFDKGAFETLLTQMSTITPSENTLILADEIESVTEPGVAGSIVAASAEYFITKGCYLVIATHLGKEIQKNLPKNARIDGIEAKGLDEFSELIVDHNPVLGRLANSTPELIVEKLSIKQRSDYFSYLNNYLKKQND